MHEKELNTSEYLDLYGDILDERPRTIMEMYFNEDYSLSEISEITGITRQAVSESIKKSTERLRNIEDKLHFKKRIEAYEKCRDQLAYKVMITLKGAYTDDDIDNIVDDIKGLSV